MDELQDFIHSTLAVHCNPILDVTTCSDKANKYASKWLSMEAAQVTREIERLQLMIDNEESSANAGLRRWMRERKDILEIISIHRHQIMSGVHLAEQASGQYGKSDEL